LAVHPGVIRSSSGCKANSRPDEEVTMHPMMMNAPADEIVRI